MDSVLSIDFDIVSQKSTTPRGGGLEAVRALQTRAVLGNTLYCLLCAVHHYLYSFKFVVYFKTMMENMKEM